MESLQLEAVTTRSLTQQHATGQDHYSLKSLISTKKFPGSSHQASTCHCYMCQHVSCDTFIQVSKTHEDADLHQCEAEHKGDADRSYQFDQVYDSSHNTLWHAHTILRFGCGAMHWVCPANTIFQPASHKICGCMPSYSRLLGEQTHLNPSASPCLPGSAPERWRKGVR